MLQIYGFSENLYFVDHACSADHADQVDPADCGGPADNANSILMYVRGPVVLFSGFSGACHADSLGIWVQAGCAFAGNPVSSNKLT